MPSGTHAPSRPCYTSSTASTLIRSAAAPSAPPPAPPVRPPRVRPVPAATGPPPGPLRRRCHRCGRHRLCRHGDRPRPALAAQTTHAVARLLNRGPPSSAPPAPLVWPDSAGGPTNNSQTIADTHQERTGPAHPRPPARSRRQRQALRLSCAYSILAWSGARAAAARGLARCPLGIGLSVMCQRHVEGDL
jgi:hypothetical protein